MGWPLISMIMLIWIRFVYHLAEETHSFLSGMDVVAPASPAAVGWGATDAEPPFSVITMASNLLVKSVIAFP